jgi:hypothetical protein
MNNDHTDPWESEMSREFDRRVRDLHEAPLTFENVKGKAMTIRRNRRIAVAGGVLAAAAVIVPVAVFAGDGLGRTDDRQDFATNSPSPTQATDPNDPTPTEAPVGTPGAGYLEGATWHRADGTTVQLDRRYDGGAELGDNLYAVRNNDGLTLDLITADGSVFESFDVLSYPVTDADHTTVAYIDAEGMLVVDGTESGGPVADGFADGDTVAAVTGPDEVFINHGDGTTPEVVDSEGNREEAVPDALKINDVSPDGRIAAQTGSEDAGSCSAVRELDGPIVFETCDYSFENFSPDGAYLSGTDAYRDGFGQGYVVILDAEGSEVARWEGTEGGAIQWVWEDNTHLLINAYEQGEWRIYRMSVDGTTERVDSSKGAEFPLSFTLLGAS